MFLRLPSSRRFFGTRKAKHVTTEALPKDVEDTPDDRDALRADEPMDIALPGAVGPVERKKNRRWQPLFRDPSFGGSIDDIKARIKVVRSPGLSKQRSYIFEDEAEHFFKGSDDRSKDSVPEGRLRDAWKIVVEHKDIHSESDPGSPGLSLDLGRTTPTSPSSPALAANFRRTTSKFSTHSAFSNISSSSGGLGRSTSKSVDGMWPSEQSEDSAGRRASCWPSESSQSQTFPSEEHRDSAHSSRGSGRSTLSAPQLPKASQAGGEETQEPERKSQLTVMLRPWRSGGSKGTPNRTPRSPKSPKSPKSPPSKTVATVMNSLVEAVPELQMLAALRAASLHERHESESEKISENRPSLSSKATAQAQNELELLE